jgi:hypothetical protein
MVGGGLEFVLNRLGLIGGLDAAAASKKSSTRRDGRYDDA